MPASTLLLAALAFAQADAPRFKLAEPRIEPAAQASSRYTLNARFHREETAGELREGDRFQLIGRLAKAGQSCDFSAVFKNGFE